MKIAGIAAPLFAASVAIAQQTAPRVASYRARLVGVFDARTGQAIEGAEVRDLKSNLSALTSTTGTVRLTFLPEGGGLVRIRKIGDPERRLFVSAIRNEGMGRIGGHRSGVMAGSWIEERASGIETGPSDVIRRKVRWSG